VPPGNTTEPFMCGGEASLCQITLATCYDWATVCKPVRPKLSDRCPVLSVCLSVLSVIMVYSDQTVGWIKMKLGAQLLSPGHTVLDGEPVPPPQRGTAPIFGPYLLGQNCWMDYDAIW